MRKILFASVAAVSLLASVPARPQQAVLCVNCSTITQQLLGYARQLYQLQQEIQTVQNTFNTFLNLTQNSVNLPGTIYRDLTADINRIESLANQATMLGGNTGAMIGNLGQSGGYPAALVQNWQQQLVAENNAIALAMQQMGAVLALQPGQLNNYAATLASLQAQGMSSGGWQQTLQTLNGVNATIGQAIIHQNSTVATALQGLATYETARADRDALQQMAAQMDEAGGVSYWCSVVAQTGGTLAVCNDAGTGVTP
jgi:P-type conjugative transfer protein TrbJ